MISSSILNFLAFIAMAPMAMSMVHDKVHHQSKRFTLWGLVNDYQGSNFYNGWSFVGFISLVAGHVLTLSTQFSYPDPTHGMVNFVTQSEASTLGLAYIDGSGRAIMRGLSTISHLVIWYLWSSEIDSR
jgi:hypothetical protein